MPPQAPEVAACDGNGAQGQTRIAVLGASGYTGEEVVRLLALHPTFAVKVLTGETQAGKVRVLCFGSACTIFQHLRGGELPVVPSESMHNCVLQSRAGVP